MLKILAFGQGDVSHNTEHPYDSKPNLTVILFEVLVANSDKINNNTVYFEVHRFYSFYSLQIMLISKESMTSQQD